MQKAESRHAASPCSQGRLPGDHSSGRMLSVRQYKHSMNPNGGIDSRCLRCRAVVASANDEWLLLDCEQRHVCKK